MIDNLDLMLSFAYGKSEKCRIDLPGPGLLPIHRNVKVFVIWNRSNEIFIFLRLDSSRNPIPFRPFLISLEHRLIQILPGLFIPTHSIAGNICDIVDPFS